MGGWNEKPFSSCTHRSVALESSWRRKGGAVAVKWQVALLWVVCFWIVCNQWCLYFTRRPRRRWLLTGSLLFAIFLKQPFRRKHEGVSISCGAYLTSTATDFTLRFVAILDKDILGGLLVVFLFIFLVGLSVSLVASRISFRIPGINVQYEWG